MAKVKYSYTYHVRIKEETTPILSDIAGDLGFISQRAGFGYGKPSPARFLDALAQAYIDNPQVLLNALMSAGVSGASEEEETQRK